MATKGLYGVFFKKCAKENGVLLMEAFAYLHSPIVSAVKTEVEKIGEADQWDCQLEHVKNLKS